MCILVENFNFVVFLQTFVLKELESRTRLTTPLVPAKLEKSRFGTTSDGGRV